MTLFIHVSVCVRGPCNDVGAVTACIMRNDFHMTSTSSNISPSYITPLLRICALRNSLFVEVHAILEHMLEAAQHPLESLAVDREAQRRRHGCYRRLATLVGQKGHLPKVRSVAEPLAHLRLAAVQARALDLALLDDEKRPALVPLLDNGLSSLERHRLERIGESQQVKVGEALKDLDLLEKSRVGADDDDTAVLGELTARLVLGRLAEDRFECDLGDVEDGGLRGGVDEQICLMTRECGWRSNVVSRC